MATYHVFQSPHTEAWTSYSAEDGHTAQGFYTFVVNGGSVGILNGTAQSQTAAADHIATLTVTSGAAEIRVKVGHRVKRWRTAPRMRLPAEMV